MSFAPRGVDSEAPLESLSEETLLSCLETVSLEAKRRALYSLLKKEEFLKHAIDRLTYNKQREEKEKESLQPQMLMSDDQQGLFLANERLFELQMQRDIREAAMKSATFSLLLEHAYNSAETDAYAREVCTLDAEKNRLANEMMGIEKNLRQIYARMSQLHIENTRLLEENRALHLQAKGLDAEEDAFNQNPAVANLRNEILSLQKQSAIIRHTLMNLIIQSGVNWASDPKLRDLFPSLENEPNI